MYGSIAKALVHGTLTPAGLTRNAKSIRQTIAYAYNTTPVASTGGITGGTWSAARTLRYQASPTPAFHLLPLLFDSAVDGVNNAHSYRIVRSGQLTVPAGSSGTYTRLYIGSADNANPTGSSPALAMASLANGATNVADREETYNHCPAHLAVGVLVNISPVAPDTTAGGFPSQPGACYIQLRYGSFRGVGASPAVVTTQQLHLFTCDYGNAYVFLPFVEPGSDTHMTFDRVVYPNVPTFATLNLTTNAGYGVEIGFRPSPGLPQMQATVELLYADDLMGRGCEKRSDQQELYDIVEPQADPALRTKSTAVSVSGTQDGGGGPATPVTSTSYNALPTLRYGIYEHDTTTKCDCDGRCKCS